MMTNRSHPGAAEIQGVGAPPERAILIGNQLADFIMASAVPSHHEQAGDMTARDHRLVHFHLARRGRSRHAAEIA